MSMGSQRTFTNSKIKSRCGQPTHRLGCSASHSLTVPAGSDSVRVNVVEFPVGRGTALATVASSRSFPFVSTSVIVTLPGAVGAPSLVMVTSTCRSHAWINVKKSEFVRNTKMEVQTRLA